MVSLDISLAKVIDGCTECGNCVRHCAFLRRHGTPKVLAGRFRDAALAPEVVYACSLCGLCDVHCPEALPLTELFWGMRRRLVAEGRGPLPQHQRILRYERWGLSPLLRLTAVPEGADTVFYPGCALAGTRPTQTRKVFELLRSRNPTLGIVLNCCAKPSHDLGRSAFFERAFGAQIDNLKARGIGTVITACPGCYRVFFDYGAGLEVRTVCQALDGLLPQQKIAAGPEVCVHDPCAVRFEPEMHQQVRDQIARLGLKVGDMKYQRRRTLCCGEGGLACYVAPDITGQWAEERAAQAAGRPLVTYCAGCVEFLSNKIDTVHLLDLLLDPEAALAGRTRTSSSPFTWLNRLRLKFTLRRDRRRAHD